MASFSINGETYQWTEPEEGMYHLNRKMSSGEYVLAGRVIHNPSTEDYEIDAPGLYPEWLDSLNGAKDEVERTMTFCRFNDDECENEHLYGSEFCEEHDKINRLKAEWDDKAEDLARKYDKQAREWEWEDM